MRFFVADRECSEWLRSVYHGGDFPLGMSFNTLSFRVTPRFCPSYLPPRPLLNQGFRHEQSLDHYLRVDGRDNGIMGYRPEERYGGLTAGQISAIGGLWVIQGDATVIPYIPGMRQKRIHHRATIIAAPLPN